jgi:hypothetical protein
MIITQRDLFELAAGPHLDPEQRRRLKLAATQRRGLHAALPGSGPIGETCGSCRHLYRKRMSKTYLKCGLCRDHWTGGAGTDVRARDASCAKWGPEPE